MSVDWRFLCRSIPNCNLVPRRRNNHARTAGPALDHGIHVHFAAAGERARAGAGWHRASAVNCTDNQVGLRPRSPEPQPCGRSVHRLLSVRLRRLDQEQPDSGRSSRGGARFDELQERNNEILRKVLEEAAAAKNPATQKIGDYYASCMDEAAIERKGVTPLDADLQKIAALKSVERSARAPGRACTRSASTRSSPSAPKPISRTRRS